MEHFTVPTNEVRTTCNPTTNATSTTPGFCDLSQYLTAGVGGGRKVFDPTVGVSNTGTGRTPISKESDSDQQNFSGGAPILAAFPAPQNSSVTEQFHRFGFRPVSAKIALIRELITQRVPLSASLADSASTTSSCRVRDCWVRLVALEMDCLAWQVAPLRTTTVWLAALRRPSAPRY